MMNRDHLFRGLEDFKLSDTERRKLADKGIRFRKSDGEVSRVQTKSSMEYLDKYLKDRIRYRVEELVKRNYSNSQLYYKGNMPGNPVQTNWTQKGNLSKKQSNLFYEDFIDNGGFSQYRASNAQIAKIRNIQQQQQQQQPQQQSQQPQQQQQQQQQPIAGHFTKAFHELEPEELSKLIDDYENETGNTMYYNVKEGVNYGDEEAQFEYTYQYNDEFKEYADDWLDDYHKGEITFDHTSEGEPIVGYRPDGTPVTLTDFRNGNL